MKNLKVKWTGYRPMIMHSAAMIDPDNSSVRAKAQLQTELKRLKKDDYTGREEVRRKIERAEWEGSIYWDSELGLVVPVQNILACIFEGAKKIKAGKQAQSALVPGEDSVAIKAANAYPHDLEKLYALPEYSLRQAVRIPPKTGSRVMSVRPMVPTGWSIEFDQEFDEKVLPEADLVESMNQAGALIGLGDWRPRFGRFSVEVVE